MLGPVGPRRASGDPGKRVGHGRGRNSRTGGVGRAVAVSLATTGTYAAGRMIGLTRAFAKEMARLRIAVYAIAPGCPEHRE